MLIIGRKSKTFPFAPVSFSELRISVRRNKVQSFVIESKLAKTGTAELGASKKYVNSWIIGFFPYEKPKYAFAVIMEKGPVENTVGGLYIMRQALEWMNIKRL